MPFTSSAPDFTTFPTEDKRIPHNPTWSETWDAAFRMENDVVNAVDLLNKPAFKEDPSFDWISKLKSSPYWEDYKDNFVGTRSEAEYNYRVGQIEQERRASETLSRSGMAGIVATIGASMASPTILMPFVGEERGLAAFASAAKWGFLGAAIQEAPLIANQETRTWKDVALSLGTSTLIGGALGGAVRFLEPEARARIEADMGDKPGEFTISTQSAGSAASRPEFAGGIDPGPLGIAGRTIKVLDSNAITRSPVTSNLTGDSDSVKFLTAQYSDAGLSLEGNKLRIPTTPGGTIENAVKLWNRNYEDAIRSIDDNYAEYIFNNKPPKIGANQLATVMGHFSREYMSKDVFRQEISRAMFSGDVHENAFVEKVAKEIRAKYFDPLEKEAVRVGLLTEKQSQDPSYLARMFNVEAVRANRKSPDGLGFKEYLARQYQTKLEADFSERLGKFNESQRQKEEFISDVQKPEGEIALLRKQFLKELETIEGSKVGGADITEDVIRSLRSQAREEGGVTLASRDRKRQLLKDAREMEASLGPLHQETKARKAELNRRLRNLSKAQVVLESRHAKKLEKIDRAEELSQGGLRRLINKGHQILQEMENWTDEKLDAELSKLKSAFAETARLYDKGEEKIAALSEEQTAVEGDAARIFDYGFQKSAQAKEFQATGATEQGLTEIGRQEVRADKMSKLSEQIADAEDLGRPAVRDLLENMIQEAAAKQERINSRRAVRTERLRGQAEKLTPEALDDRIKAIREQGTVQEVNFNESVRKMGADSIDRLKGTADFTRFANESADSVVNKILGTYLRLPTVELLQDKRGPELARALDVPSTDLLPWLENDIEKIIRSHVMTLGPDIEIQRKFGTVNMDEILTPMWDEMQAAKEQVNAATQVDKGLKRLLKDKFGIKSKEGQPLTDVQKEDMTRKIDQKYQGYKDNLIAIHERLRHTFGLPKDPDGVAYRLGRVVANLNVLRYMGSVTVSSIPDMAAPITKYGLLHVFREAFVPMITNFKAFKMSAREARYAGVANDAILNTRAQTILDITDNLRRGSKLERGVEYLTSKQGVLALFNHWTDVMKQFTAVSANAKLMDSIHRAVVKGENKSWQYLAQVGIGPQEASRIWDTAQAAGGAEKQQGVWLPNTESWTDADAKRFYRTALAREVDRGIVTPGVERPLWTNASQTGRLISQFKSFAFSSTYRTLLAGMQQRDAAFVTGTMASLGLGALSYYLYAITAGGKPYDDMQNAGMDRWADEAIQRSGMLAVFGLGQDLLSRIPATGQYASFSGARTTRRGGDDLLQALAGPTYGDLVNKVASVINQADDPTTSTVHKFRSLLPFQNLFWLRQLFDQIEQSNPLDLPQRRGQ